MASSPTIAAAEAVDVILRDGGTLRLRPPGARRRRAARASSTGLSDAEPLPALPRLRRVDRGSSSRSSTPTGSSAARSSAVSPTREREERIVAVASYTRLRDERDGRGRVRRRRRRAGPRDRHAAARAARRAGLARRDRALRRRGAGRRTRRRSRVFADAGFELVRSTRERRGRAALPDRADRRDFAARVDERDHAAVVASLRPFFSPATVAVIGASRRRGSIGGELFRNILAGGLRGRRLPGQPAAASRSPACAPTARSRRSRTTVDLAVICLPAEHVLDAGTERCATASARCA